VRQQQLVFFITRPPLSGVFSGWDLSSSHLVATEINGPDITNSFGKLAVSFGSSFARSTGLVKTETLRTLRQKAVTARMFSTTRVTIRATFLGLSSSISSLG